MIPSALAYTKLKKGDSGAEVLAMQKALKSLGYTLSADGKYGAGTVNIVKQFQKKNGLTADGVAGNKTLSLLYSMAKGGPTPTAAPGALDENHARVTTGGGSLKLRAKKSTAANAAVRAYLPDGAVVRLLSRDKTWCQVEYEGKTGYVLTEFLTFAQEKKTPKPTAKPTAKATAAPTQKPAAPGKGTVAYVTTANGKSLNMRSAANSRQNNVVAQIPNGTRLLIASKGKTWCKTAYNGLDGYVMTAYLSFPVASTPTPKPAATQKPGGDLVKGFVNTSNGGGLNLRKSASDSAAVLAQIPSGAEVVITSRGSTWCAVKYGNLAGYVMTKYLYIPLSVATPVPGNATPKPQQGAAFTRTLRSGFTGEDVTWVQTKLKELGYLSRVSGTYDAATITAVKHFQKQNGLGVDGLAGAQTFALLASPNALRASDGAVAYETLRIDQTGSEVTQMQNALIKLGYPLKATGEYDVDTHNAVVAFQVRNNLVISGIADGLTRTVIMGGKGKPYSTPVQELPANTGWMATPTHIQLLHWQDEIKPTVKAGQVILVFDPQTNLSWQLTFYSLGRHADSQPTTWKDTQIMNRSFGSTSWTIHPVYVKLPSGVWTIATMHNRPHLVGSITANGFGGHLCVHFLRTMSEAQQNDPQYGVQNQVTLRNAWRALTGETITY